MKIRAVYIIQYICIIYYILFQYISRVRGVYFINYQIAIKCPCFNKINIIAPIGMLGPGGGGGFMEQILQFIIFNVQNCT